MPIYEYEALNESSCATCSKRFEAYQKMDEASLKQCPACNAPVRRVFSAPSIHGQDMLSNKSLAEKGFTKYEKAGDGVYEKKAGSGPDVIQR